MKYKLIKSYAKINLSLKISVLLERIEMLSNKLCAITGNIVFSSKLPLAEENVIVLSLPIT